MLHFHKLFLFLSLLVLGGRDGLAQGNVHYIVGVDRSASRSSQQMKDMRDFLAGLVEQVSHGDALSVMQIFQVRSDQVVEFRGTVPPLRYLEKPGRRDEIALATARRSFQRSVLRFSDTTGMKNVVTTDIIGFLHRASDYARAKDGRRVVVVVLSDMLQSVQGMEFERIGAIPGRQWIATQEREGLLPQLTGVCVVAVGAEQGSVRSVRVRDFWVSYVKAAGGSLAVNNYRTFMRPNEISC